MVLDDTKIGNSVKISYLCAKLLEMKISRHEDMLFALLRYAINGIALPESEFEGCGAQDWEKCYALAGEQGVGTIAWDAVMALPEALQPPRVLKLRWAMAVENYTKIYNRYCRAVAELSEFYASHGIATVQLKGVGLSTYYKVPERRQGGDIDIYTYSLDKTKMSDKEANDLADRLMRDRGIEIDIHSYKHSNFFYKGISIENHKFFANVKHHCTAAEADKLLLENFNPCRVTLPGGYEIMVPSPEFNSIFIILHALQHFTTGMALHHLCDWACVLNKIDSKLPLSLEDENFTRAVRAMNLLCREYLGSDLPKDEGLDDICDILMKEMLYPKFTKEEMPGNPLGVLWFKTRRFAHSSRMMSKVWNTTVAKAVWQSVIAHIKHPETIFTRG